MCVCVCVCVEVVYRICAGELLKRERERERENSNLKALNCSAANSRID